MFIFAVLLTGTAFAYGWRVDQGGVKFERRDGTYPSEQWEWIDGDNSGKAYRYYFNALGYRLADTVTPDFEIVDDQGRWMVEGNLKFNEVTRLPDEEFAKLLASKPREALRAAKHEIVATMHKDLKECLNIEIKEFASTLQTDGKRIIAEWFEKKK